MLPVVDAVKLDIVGDTPLWEVVPHNTRTTLLVRNVCAHPDFSVLNAPQSIGFVMTAKCVAVGSDTAVATQQRGHFSLSSDVLRDTLLERDVLPTTLKVFLLGEPGSLGRREEGG